MAKEQPKSAPAEKPHPPAAPPDPSGSGGKKRLLTFGIFGGVMIVEAVAVFACMKMFGAEPDPTHGIEPPVTTTSKPWEESHELPVAQVRVPTTTGARPMIYSVKVVIRVHHSNKTKVKEFLENRKSTIEDTISRVIRSADERHLAEPGLETLKRQIRFELGALFGDEETIEQVLIPECMPLPTGL